MAKIKKKHCESKEREFTRNEYTKMQKDNRDYAKIVAERDDDMKSFFWQGIDPRRRQEYSDGGMIREDHNAMANLPKKAIMKEYPNPGYYSTPLLDELELE